MKKRLFALLLAAVLCFTLFGCGGGDGAASSNSENSDNTTTTTALADNTDTTTDGTEDTAPMDGATDTTEAVEDTTAPSEDDGTTTQGENTQAPTQTTNTTNTTADTTTTVGSATKTEAPSNGTVTTATTKTTVKTTEKTTGKTTVKTTEKAPTTAKPTTQAPANTSNLKKSTYVKNANVWDTPNPAIPFVFQMQTVVLGQLNSVIAKNTIKKLQLGDVTDNMPNSAPNTAHEWAYSFYHLNNQSHGGGSMVIQGGFNPVPKTRSEALKQIEAHLNKQYGLPENGWVSMTGHYPYQHYAAEFGADYVGSEIGENVFNYQMSIAFDRGAARQYRTSWFIDFSSWYGGVLTDFAGAWPEDGGVNNGHSGNLMKRAFIMSYMSGADQIIAEGGAALAMYPEIDPATGGYKLTPYGEIYQEFYAFTKKVPDVGTTYTPFGIVIDFYHGLHAGDNGHNISWSQDLVFQTFPRTEGDRFNQRVLEIFYPDAFGGERTDETECMRNNPYGDTADVITHNASSAVLNSYPCLILAGDLKLNDTLIKRYEDYVAQGGTLILNTAYTSQLTKFNKSMKYGNGEVIVYGPNYSVENLDSILKNQLKKLMPFTFSADVEYIVNVKDGTFYVTIINNDGVKKGYTTPVQIDNSKAKNVTVTFTGSQAVKSVKELYYGKNIKVSGKQATVNLGAGDYAVLAFQFD